ncbi:MAE_28990/MAE_18760 family HEPN-like nuclease [Microbispora sp. NBC_01189]|uniref:MAE_28990/MAE_18760 family HEPN-like nuclease n=1 Tax=Microbispora sp. NBC_01189 TaxID=2903583 RepID=UPI002E102412|nr:MAE_28990/MAE_18760 family HEPN-like nuclease [Microbispora sp. NBC_01189]
MNSSDLLPFFTDRLKEVESYVNFLGELERSAQSGVPKIVGSAHPITASQQKILYSSLYLQLYNLVEATVSRCISALCMAAQDGQQWRPEHLNPALQREWVRAMARTHVDLSPENRLAQAVAMCNHLIDKLPIDSFEIEVGGGGNWDDEAIDKIGKRIGCRIAISPGVQAVVKRPLRDDMGALKLVKNRRNNLAHGSISFVDCADGIGVSELRMTVDAIGAYLREVIDCFISHIHSYEYLKPEHKPRGVA